MCLINDMKKAFQKYFTVFMSLVVLSTSTGFGVVEHHCMMRGKQIHLLLLEKDNCHGCEHEHESANTPVSDQTTIQKKSCCNDQQHYQHLDTSSSPIHFVAKFLKVLADSFVVALIDAFKIVLVWLADLDTSFTSTFSFSSLFHGRSMLSWVQVWLI